MAREPASGDTAPLDFGPICRIATCRIATRRSSRGWLGALLPLAAGLWLLAGPAMAADAARGQSVFGNCFACHAVGPDPPPRAGPELNGLLGRAAGGLGGYAYSDAMRDSGIVWSAETLRPFLGDPRGTVPGTRMFFAGLRDPQQVEDLIAYLAQFAADGTPGP